MKTLATALLVATAAAWSAATAWAQDSVPRVFPYEGVLALDGAFVDGDLDLRFTIYDSTDTAIWEEEHSTQAATSDCGGACSVTFYRGRFSLLLGEYVYLTRSGTDDGDWIFDGTNDTGYELGISVFRDGSWVVLSGRQAIAPVPYALWNVAGAAGFALTGQLSADGIRVTGDVRDGCDITLSEGFRALGTLDVGTVNARGSISISGNLSAGDLDLEGGDLRTSSAELNWQDGGTTRTGLRDSGSGTLAINPDGEFSTVEFNNGRVDVSGTLTVTGNLQVGDQVFEVGSSTFRGADPLFQYLSINMGTATTYDTSVAYADWHCAVVGIDLGAGDMNEESSQTTLVSAFTYKSGSTWRVHADWASHSDEDETHEVRVLCIQDGFVSGTWDPN